MSDNDLGTKVRALNVSEIMENLMPSPDSDPREAIARILKRQEARAPEWRFRLRPERDPGGYFIVTAVKDLAKMEFLLSFDPRAGVLTSSAEVSFLDYPLKLSVMKQKMLLSEIFDLRCDELSAWLNAQSTLYKNQPQGG